MYNIWISLLYPLSFLIICSSSDFNYLLEETIKQNDCRPECIFNQSEITSTTIRFYPYECSDICGILKINENTDLSFDELKTILKKMRTLRGGLIIENTNFNNLSFLPSSERSLSFYCFPVGTSIVNNSHLIDGKSLFKIDQWSIPPKECKFVVSNNSKLEISSLCESRYYERLQKLEVYNNKKDCGCIGGHVTMEKMGSFKKCSEIFGGLKLLNLTSEIFSNSFSTIKIIKGNVEIANTDFTDLSFFKSLQKIKGQAFENRETVILNIHDNPNIKRLGLNISKMINEFLTDVEYEWPPTMNLENLHPDFCLTYQEASIFAHVKFKFLHAKFCENQNFSSFNKNKKTKLCFITTIKELDQNCTIIFGNVLIQFGDEEYVNKLVSTKEIYGSLVIQNTELEDVKFLNSLKRIYYLHESLPFIRIFNNRKLKKFTLTSFEFSFARGKKSVIIENNAPNLFRAAISCLAFQSKIKANVTYNGKNCKAIEEVNRQTRIGLFHIFMGFMILTLIKSF